MELILGILGLLCALYFALLVSIGMDFSWIWLVGAVLFWGIAAVHKYTVLHSIVIAKGLKIAVITVFAIGLLVFVIAEGCIVSRMSAEPKEDLDYMIVLGAQVHGERPSRALKLRLEKAAQECRPPKNQGIFSFKKLYPISLGNAMILFIQSTRLILR